MNKLRAAAAGIGLLAAVAGGVACSGGGGSGVASCDLKVSVSASGMDVNAYLTVQHVTDAQCNGVHGNSDATITRIQAMPAGYVAKCSGTVPGGSAGLSGHDITAYGSNVGSLDNLAANALCQALKGSS